MDKKIKLSLLLFVSVSAISACTQTSPNNDIKNPNTGVTHTHNGIAHTHRLPVEGLQHAHNINSGNANRTCQPCGSNTNNTGSGNCHIHEGRRHCHPLPASGSQHSHNTQQGAGVIEPAVSNPATNPVIRYQPPTSTTIPYPTTPSNQPPVTVNNQPNPNSAPNPYYTPEPYSTNTTPSSQPPYYPSNPANNPTSNPPQNVANTSCNTAGGNNYVVQPKDGVYRIGVNNGVKRNDIIRLNNLQAPDYTIQPGQCLRLR